MSFVNRGTSRHNAKNAKLGSLLDQFQCVGIGGNQGSDGNSIRRKIVIVRSIDYNYVINLHTADALHQHGDIYAWREPNDPRSEERRVGKECRSWWARDHEMKALL